MTPNTRKRKSLLASEIADKIVSMNLNSEDQVDVINLALKNLNILDQFKFPRKPAKKGRKLLPYYVRENA